MRSDYRRSSLVLCSFVIAHHVHLIEIYGEALLLREK